MDQTESLVGNLVAQSAGLKAEDIELQTALGPDGIGLDSIAVVDLLLSIEAASGVRLRNESLTADSLSTVGNLILYIRNLKEV